MDVAVIYGTRPEAIKVAPVIRALQECGACVTVINTGQHDSLMPEVMALFSVTVDHNLKVLRPEQPLGKLMGRMVTKVTGVLSSKKFDRVVVQGDTMTALAGALAAFYVGVPLAHVEAGLRTHNLNAPFPEEANRRLIGSIASWNFAPSEQAAKNLIDERVPGRTFMTGNTIVDALRAVDAKVAGSRSATTKRVIVTVHRRENFPYLEGIFTAISRIADSGVEVIFPVHPNPTVTEAANKWLNGSGVILASPMDYLPWIGLLKTAHLIITDSGGLQEEAPILGIPLLILRQVTERTEVVDGGYGYLVGVNQEDIVSMTMAALEGKLLFRRGSPYGDGTASNQISKIMLQGRSDEVPAFILD